MVGHSPRKLKCLADTNVWLFRCAKIVSLTAAFVILQVIGVIERWRYHLPTSLLEDWHYICLVPSSGILRCMSSCPQDFVILVFLKVLRTHSCVIWSISFLSSTRGSSWFQTTHIFNIQEIGFLITFLCNIEYHISLRYC